MNHDPQSNAREVTVLSEFPKMRLVCSFVHFRRMMDEINQTDLRSIMEAT